MPTFSLQSDYLQKLTRPFACLMETERNDKETHGKPAKAVIFPDRAEPTCQTQNQEITLKKVLICNHFPVDQPRFHSDAFPTPTPDVPWTDCEPSPSAACSWIILQLRGD